MLNHILKDEQLQKERATIQSSRLLTQAKAPRKDGLIHVVAVYEMSNERFFFFTYTAKTLRSPRRTWKPAGYNIVNDGRAYSSRGKGKLDLREFLKRQNYYIQPGAKWKVRYPHRKPAFTARFEQVGNPFDHGIKQIITPGSTFITAEWKATGRKPSKYRKAILTVPKPTNYDTGDN
jgi:hypothetical protein